MWSSLRGAVSARKAKVIFASPRSTVARMRKRWRGVCRSGSRPRSAGRAGALGKGGWERCEDGDRAPWLQTESPLVHANAARNVAALGKKSAWLNQNKIF